MMESLSHAYKQTIDYAPPAGGRPASRVGFYLWLMACVAFLAASCGSLLAYVWWLKLG